MSYPPSTPLPDGSPFNYTTDSPTPTTSIGVSSSGGEDRDVRQGNEESRGRNVQRGKNWNEEDSVRLVQAYAQIESVKKRTTTNDDILIKAYESKATLNRRMYEYWLSLVPSEPNRTQKSVIMRWSEMVSKFKLFFIVSTKTNYIDLSSVSTNIK